MIYPLILFIAVNLAVILSIGRNKWLLRFYLINILIIIIYNLAGWGYLFNYMDAGGASLGPGLMLMFITGLHLIILVVFTGIKIIISRGRIKKTSK